MEVAERDETAEICTDAKGKPEPDPELRDYENVPLKEDINEYMPPRPLDEIEADLKQIEREIADMLADGVPFLSAESVKNDRLYFNKKRGFVSEQDHERFSKKYAPKRGDVYMVKSGATTGNVARVETDEIFNIWSPLAVLRPNPARCSTNFVFYFVKSRPFLTSVELARSYGTQQNIGMGVISNIKFTLPPITEQMSMYVRTSSHDIQQARNWKRY